jgi:membrane protease subunit HflC
MNKVLLGTLGVVAVVLIGVSQAFYIVDQREQAIVLQLGQPVGEVKGPGLHMKLPIVQDVRYFDRRVLSVDPAPDQVVISNQAEVVKQSAEEKNNQQDGEEEIIPSIKNVSGEPIIVDTFARYKIVDPLQFLKSLGTITIANERLDKFLTESTRAVLGNTSLSTLLSDGRDQVMNDIQTRVNAATKRDKLGIEIVDVRIVRADLTAALLNSTVQRMNSELLERATEARAKGEEEALKITSEAEKERTVILANSQRDAQMVRGQGDEEAIRIYAKAFNKDKEFYSFIRSLEAYGKTMADPDTRLILSPDSDFFKYFTDMSAQ